MAELSQSQVTGQSPGSQTTPLRKTREWQTFLFVTVVLFPLLSVAGVGTLGLVIWIYQTIAGPPGPPPR